MENYMIISDFPLVKMMFRFSFNIFNRQVLITKNSCHVPDDITKMEFWKQTIKGHKFKAHCQIEDETP